MNRRLFFNTLSAIGLGLVAVGFESNRDRFIRVFSGLIKKHKIGNRFKRAEEYAAHVYDDFMKWSPGQTDIQVAYMEDGNRSSSVKFGKPFSAANSAKRMNMYVVFDFKLPVGV